MALDGQAFSIAGKEPVLLHADVASGRGPDRVEYQVIAFPVDLAFNGIATKSVDAFLAVRGVAELGCNTPLFARLRCRHLKNRIVLFDGIYAAGGRGDGAEVVFRRVHLQSP